MNSTNGTTTPQDPYTVTMRIAIVSAYVVIFTIALFGNSVGLYVVCGKAASRRITNLLIKNLAVADLIFTLTIMPYSAISIFFDGSRWFGGLIVGTITCKAIFFAVPLSVAASVTTMVVISLDRFCAVYFPLNRSLFHRHKAVTSFIWLFSLIIMIPNLFILTVSKEGDYYYCYESWPWADDLEETFFALRTFHVILFVLFYPLPLLIITVVNSLVGRRLWLHKTPGSRYNVSRTAIEVSRRKVVKMLVILVIIFAVCWFPTHLLHYFAYYDRPALPNIPIMVVHFLFWVSHANSAINPLMYIALNKNFRYSFLDASVALFTSPVRALSACMAYLSGEKSTPESHFTNDHPARQRQQSAFRVSPAAVGNGLNAKRSNDDTKL